MLMRIKELIKEKGFNSEREFADKNGITHRSGLRQNVSAGKPVIPTTLEILQRIADAIGGDVVELFDPIENGKSPTIICPNCGKEITIKVE